jgi:hypothetical protein
VVHQAHESLVLVIVVQPFNANFALKKTIGQHLPERLKAPCHIDRFPVTPRLRHCIGSARGESRLGATFHKGHLCKEEFAQPARYDQIIADVERRRPARWLAIDDDIDGWPEHALGNVVQISLGHLVGYADEPPHGVPVLAR